MGDKSKLAGHDNIAYESEDCTGKKTNQIELDDLEFVTRNDDTSEKETNGWWVEIIHKKVRVKVVNGTFNNISVIWWQSILLVEETEVPRENHRPVASGRQSQDTEVKRDIVAKARPGCRNQHPYRQNVKYTKIQNGTKKPYYASYARDPMSWPLPLNENEQSPLISTEVTEHKKEITSLKM